ncbi:uncharacterized protein LOC123553954 isoform X1 [Mercenaria mercenaria]|uniref:uncharacterized protein LOC123553954 isoform X1 n=1 Tax=Mercenaria mercenaria TaxID=6596 RepID=UPI00234E8441|nr:uncharacterized protein LOC123553954 isoform X1 [Mercenaria mercenaria]
MSVILTSCRHSKQRAIARALKKRAEKQRVRRLLKLKKEAELQELEASALEAFTKMWSFEIAGEYYSVMLYLATDKDTVDIFCNDDEVHYNVTDVTSAGATFEFMVGASFPARIACQGNPHTGLVHTLFINECIVPEAD